MNIQQTNSQDYLQKKKRQRRWIIFGITALIVFSTTIQTYIQQLKVRSPIANNIVVFAIVNINIILLIILILLVFRNLIKLYFERKQKIIGAKFRTKLIIAFVMITLVPSILLFWIANGFISTSIDNWFNTQVETSLKESLEVAQGFYQNYKKSTFFYAQQLAEFIVDQKLLDKHNKEEYLKNTLMKKLKEYGLDAIGIFDIETNSLIHVKIDTLPTNGLVDILNDIQKIIANSEYGSHIKKSGDGEWVLSISHPVSYKGIIITGYYVPLNLIKKMNNITSAFEEYTQLELLKNPIKTSYVMTFLLITLLILFSATWFGFYLAKGITIPIQELAEATSYVAEGNLDIKVEVKADDEIGLLVNSFNNMTEDLKRSKVEIEKAYEDLRKTNLELERRRQYIEAVLENINTGVISIDKQGRVSMINKSACKILNISAEGVRGIPYRNIFDASHMESVRSMIKNMNEDSKIKSEMQTQLMVSGRMVTLIVKVTTLRHDNNKYLGVVVVFDDLTELIKTQKVAAWREVARVIAHEIKNPLTPIKLNTQRLRKKFMEDAKDFKDIFEESTMTIIKEVDGLKELVDEFSRFARMPAPNPKPNNIHKVIDEVVLLYHGTSKDIYIERDYDNNVKEIRFDKEQMKRVFINLMENAIEAKNGKYIVINIKTFLDKTNNSVKIEVIDNGKGIKQELMDKLFLPYFSTKKGGTGLGLAIVNRIIADHDGIISARNNLPNGSIFTIELPV